MEKWKKRTVELLTSLAFGSRGETAVVPYYPQKNRLNGLEERFFGRSVPEKKGISSKRLYNMLCELEGERRANVHSLMVLCGGEVICECSADGYSVNEWHVSHSMSKTVLGMVIGRLVDEGRLNLDTRLVDVIPEVPYRDKKFPLITADHLLSMTAGVDFAEVGVITESDWTAAFFSSTIRFTPGTKFAYNSMNSYILAVIAERVTGRKFGELAEEYIFAPLGIKNYLWEKGPEGIEKGGWGLYMSAESWAKLGYMILCDGIFMGKRLLSEDWMRISSTVKAITPEEDGNFNYAYHIWTGRNNGELLFNGMLGQNVWICPKNDIVAVITSGNNELFQASPSLEIIRKYLGGQMNDRLNYRSIKLFQEKQSNFFDCRRWVRPLERGRGLLCMIGVRPREPFDFAWEPILGSYAITRNNVGVQPLILRAMQNNLDRAIDEISLYRRSDRLYLRIRESGESYLIAIGLYEYKESVIRCRGEKYTVRAMGEATADSYGNPEYRIELIFPESASTRMLVVRKMGEGRVQFDLSERPNQRLAEDFLNSYRETSGVVSFVADMLERRLGEGEIKKMIERIFNPILVGIDLSLPNYAEILEEENRFLGVESGTVRMIRAVVDRFFKEGTGE